MNLKANLGVGAVFKLLAHKGDPSKPTRETPSFHNLVLDAGLDRLSVGSAINRVCIGTGNSTPVASQTTLDNFLASTTTVQSANEETGNQTSVRPFYYWARRVYRFDLGVAAGNLSEVGLGWTNSNLFNRALVKDSNGNPTTITVLSDEYLDVIVELRMYPQQEISGSFNYLNKTGGLISTHTVTGGPVFTGGSGFNLGKITGKAGASGKLQVSSSSISPSTITQPAGFLAGYAVHTETYPTPRALKTAAKFELSSAVGSHKGFYASFSGLLTNESLSAKLFGYKWDINPPIAKSNQQEITYEFTLSWGRYEPT